MHASPPLLARSLKQNNPISGIPYDSIGQENAVTAGRDLASAVVDHKISGHVFNMPPEKLSGLGARGREWKEWASCRLSYPLQGCAVRLQRNQASRGGGRPYDRVPLRGKLRDHRVPQLSALRFSLSRAARLWQSKRT
jgi:hypothetical protein